MDGIYNIKKLKSWVLKSIALLNKTGITQDIHVDELLANFGVLNKHEMFTDACLLFKEMVDFLEIKKIKLNGVHVFLNIDLMSENNLFAGKPSSLAEIEDLIDEYCIPEIILYKELPPTNISLTEFYRAPILTDYFSKSTPIAIFYKELRTFESHLNNGEFIRTIEVYYMQ